MADILSEEHYKLWPLADPSCRICKMTVDEIKKLHTFKFVDGMTYEQINKYLATYYGAGVSYNVLVDHFNKHTTEGKSMQLAKKLDINVASELEKIAIDKHEANSDNIQTAYAYLTRTCMELSESSAKILTPFMEELRKMSAEKIQERVSKMSPLNALEQIARIQKLISDHVQTISQMRAPKVVVAQFLELAINEIVRQTSYIFAEALKNIEISITEDMKEKGVNMGTLVFKRAQNASVEEFKKAMMALKREQLSRAFEVLSEIEKIV